MLALFLLPPAPPTIPRQGKTVEQLGSEFGSYCAAWEDGACSSESCAQKRQRISVKAVVMATPCTKLLGGAGVGSPGSTLPVFEQLPAWPLLSVPLTPERVVGLNGTGMLKYRESTQTGVRNAT